MFVLLGVVGVWRKIGLWVGLGKLSEMGNRYPFGMIFGLGFRFLKRFFQDCFLSPHSRLEWCLIWVLGLLRFDFGILDGEYFLLYRRRVS